MDIILYVLYENLNVCTFLNRSHSVETTEPESSLLQYPIL